MKTGKTLLELATEIERQSSLKHDFLQSAGGLSMNTVGQPRLRVGDHGEFGMRPLAHRDLGTYLGIPASFYDRLLADVENQDGVRLGHTATAPATLFDVTVNTLLDDKRADVRLVRTLDGQARALLSDRYRPMDHDEILAHMLPTLASIDGIDWNASSMEVTESRLYLKLVNRKVQGEVARGDVVQAGVVLTNSETGQGSFSVSPMLFRLVCTNGLIRSELVKRKYHAGARQTADSDHLLSDEARRARNRATILEMRDLVRGALGEAMFAQSLGKLKAAAGEPLALDPLQSVALVTKRYSLTDGESGEILRNLVNGGDLSVWGMVNAVTLAAQVVESYDRSTELEQVGGKILEESKVLVTA